MSLSPRLRILQVCSSSAVSGAERHVHALSTVLQSRGHKVSAVTPPGGWLPGILNEFEVPCHTMHMRGSGWLRTMGYLVKQVRQQKIQVVHSHLTRAAYIGHAVGLLTRVPIITSVHIANNDNIYRRLARRSNRLVAVSDFVRGMLHGRGVPDRYIDTVYNGTDLLDIAYQDSGLTRESLGLSADHKIVGMVGRICREKGHLEMIQAMGQFGQDHPEAQLLFIGRVVPNFEAEMNDLIDSSNLRNRITFAGERHDVPAMLDAMTLMAMPSYMETFGVAAVEAMARGKAVVATRVGGLPEVVQDQRTGILVDPEAGQIAEAVSFLLENGEVREQMGRHARQVVEEKFTLSQMVSRFEHIYQRSVVR